MEKVEFRNIPKNYCPANSSNDRGNRLNPLKSNRSYWHLTCLRKGMEAIAKTFKGHLHGEVLVDVGCGNMPYRPLFEPIVDKYIGCDLADNKLADQVIDATGVLPFLDGQVGSVLSSQVLEHVLNPSAYLAEIRRILKPQGLLILSTHGIWKYHPDPHDYWRWTAEGLRKQIYDSSFQILSFRGIMGPEATAIQIYQDAILLRIPIYVRSLFIRYMQRSIMKADIRCSDSVRDKDASVYILTAAKTTN